MKYNVVSKTLNFDELPKYIKKSLDTEITEENYNFYFKNHIR